MFSRRTFVTSTAGSAFSIPLVSSLHTTAQSADDIEIQSTSVNAGRTRVVPGEGLVNQPGEAAVAAEDVSFVWSTESSPSIMLTAGVALAHGGDDESKYILAFDAATGEELWRDIDVNGRVGAVNGRVMYDVRPTDEAMPMHMKVVDARSGETWWVQPSQTSPAGVFPNASTVVYTHLPDMSPELVCRNLESGDVNWEIDISDVAEWTGTLPTADDEVIVVPSDSMRSWVGLTAFGVESGERLWHVDRDSGIAVPSIAQGVVWAVYPDGVESLDVQTGEAVERFNLEMVAPGTGQNQLSLAVLEDQLVITGKNHIAAVDTSTGDLMWERSRAIEGQQAQLHVVNDMVVTIEPSEDNPFDALALLRGYSLADGEVTFEWMLPDDSSTLQAFMIANDHLYASTSSGFFTFMPGNELFAPTTIG